MGTSPLPREAQGTQPPLTCPEPAGGGGSPPPWGSCRPCHPESCGQQPTGRPGPLPSLRPPHPSAWPGRPQPTCPGPSRGGHRSPGPPQHPTPARSPVSGHRDVETLRLPVTAPLPPVCFCTCSRPPGLLAVPPACQPTAFAVVLATDTPVTPPQATAHSADTGHTSCFLGSSAASWDRRRCVQRALLCPRDSTCLQPSGNPRGGSG